MRHQTVAHEEVLKACREQWDNGRCGEMISNTTDVVDPEVGQPREWPKPSADCLLSLAAAPTFPIMALLAGVNGGSMSDMLCSTKFPIIPGKHRTCTRRMRGGV